MRLQRIGTGGSSSVRIAGNTIDLNKGDGVRVRKNAKATLQGNESVGGNDGFAVVCEIAGVVDGNLAGLLGNLGPVEMDTTCVEVLDDYTPSP